MPTSCLRTDYKNNNKSYEISIGINHYLQVVTLKQGKVQGDLLIADNIMGVNNNLHSISGYFSQLVNTVAFPSGRELKSNFIISQEI